MSDRSRTLRAPRALAFAATLAIACAPAPNGDEQKPEAEEVSACDLVVDPSVPPEPSPQDRPVNALGVRYVPADSKAFVGAETIQGWADRFEDAKIERHAYDLWQAITADSGERYDDQALPVFETWFSEFEVFHVEPQPPSNASAAEAAAVRSAGFPKGRHLHTARQVAHGQLGGAHFGSNLSFNKFSLEFMHTVDRYGYHDPKNLEKLARYLDANLPPGAPLSDHVICPPPAHAVMLKPTFWIVRADAPTPVPYWKGPGLEIDGSAYPREPTEFTWEQIAVVDPKGNADPARSYTWKVVTETGTKEITKTPDEVVGLDDFYWIRLSQEDVDFLKGPFNVFQTGGLTWFPWQIPLKDLKAGDVALLVGMHVTTAEFSPWTWQTFWWSPNDFDRSNQPPGLGEPWSNYETATAYYMTKAGEPHIAFNPHLETPINGPIFRDPRERGAHSNCMTCHHVAAFQTTNRDPNPGLMLQGSYRAIGDVDHDDPDWFQGRLQTVFQWGLVMQNQAKLGKASAGGFE